MASSSRKVGIVGAGPAGLTAAKLAVERGFEVEVFEQHRHLGGIWNPHANGAYASVRMQTSRQAFHYSDFAPLDTTEFLTRQGLYDYLYAYSRRFGVHQLIRFEAQVVSIQSTQPGWSITISTPNGRSQREFDFVIIANGELWRSRLVQCEGPAPMTAKDYVRPISFAGRKVLVVGGGVSGADIAAELSHTAAQVHWSIRRRALMLPRMWGLTPNDGCFSYVGRNEVQTWDRERYLSFLNTCMPDYMQSYVATGLLPDDLQNNAIHINDTAIPAVAEGRVQVRPGVDRLAGRTRAHFLDGTADSYDQVLLCAGYQPPDYSFIQNFSPQKLYEHFFFSDDPTLAVLNTPPQADGYGTACPYFEAIAFWILQVFDGDRCLPPLRERQQWCETQASQPFRKVFYDCWQETIRIGLLSGQLPAPAEDFRSYWHIVSNGVTPFNLRSDPIVTWKPSYDHLVDLPGIRARILASLPEMARFHLVASGQIDASEASRADHLRPGAFSPALY